MECKELTKTVLQDYPDFDSHQKVVHVTDSKTGLNAYIAVHNTNIGPALGGCRMYNYRTEQDAIRDVLRLSRGMTYKNAMAQLCLGGGKSVIIGDPFKIKTEDMMKAMGCAVESLGGIYITAEDSGTCERDMLSMSGETTYVVGLPGGVGDLGGDPSPLTAYGVYCGIKAAARKRYGTESLSDFRISVQGLGAVGYGLCRMLHKDGAKLIVSDIREDVIAKARTEFPGIDTVGAEEIFSVEANIFSPCALGAQLNDTTIPKLRVDVIAGAANNQCAAPKNFDDLLKRNILYTPDYVINAGGVISAAYEYFLRTDRNPFNHDLNRKNMMVHIEKIAQTITRVFNIADARNISPARAADEMAEELFSGSHHTGDSKAHAR